MENKLLPLSDVQRSYFYGRNKSTFLGGVSTRFYMECTTSLDIEKLEKSLNCTIKEQPSLRSYITDNGMQCFMEEVPYYKIKITDLRSFSKEQQKEKFLGFRKFYSERMFELNKWPMFEFSIYRMGDNENVLIVESDMMIMDGLSTELLIESLYKYYDSSDMVEVIPVSAFEDYIKEKELKSQASYAEDKAFWNAVLEELPSGPQFEKVVDSEEPAFDTSETIISSSRWDAVKSELAPERILPSVYLTTAYAKLLSRWCGQSRITLNMTVSNRKRNCKELRSAIGDFTEIMLVDFDFTDNKSLKEKSLEIQKKISKRKKHNSVASSEIIRDYTYMHGCDNSFPFPAVCTCMLFDVAGSKWEWLGKKRYQISQTPQIMLDNQISLKDGRLVIHWDYLAAYFDSEDIKNMQAEYCSIITGDTSDVQEKYDSLARQYNTSFREREKTTLVKLFRDKAVEFPENTAVSDVKNSCAFRELDRDSDIIAGYISENCPEHHAVIIKMSRSVSAVKAILGVIKSGCYYVPIAHNCPDERLEFIKAQSKSSFILTDNKVADILKNEEWKGFIDLSQPDDIAYVIFTSGSTGTPKGVVITHDAVCNTILDINERFSVTDKDKLIGISSFSFDLSVYDIFGAASSGAELKLAPSAYDMHLIKKMMSDGSITIWNTVPSIMELLINNIDDNFINMSLKTVILSGDWIPLNLPDKVKKHFPNAKVYSFGGATEASIWSIYYPVENVESNWNSIPYGYPLENQSIWILDEKNNICPPNVRGEICIGGRGVAKGYLNDKERTDKSFVIHDTLGYIYRTGDLGLLSDKNWVTFLGRKDFQVKLHGYRIELGEIESCLSQCSNVSDAVADVKEVNGSKKLIAYVTPKSGSETRHNSDYIKDAAEHDYEISGITSEKFEELQNHLDEISLGIMERIFSELETGNEFCIDDVIDKNSIEPKFRKIVTQWADSLADVGVFEKKDGIYFITGIHIDNGSIKDFCFEEMNFGNAALGFLSSCEENAISVIKGELNFLSLFFKNGESTVADNLYGNNPVCNYYNNVTAETVKSFVSNFSENRTVRILEIGGGVGANSKAILEKISGLDYSYDFTDISPIFHDIARKNLEKYDNVRYSLLDIDKSVLEQGYQAGTYDLIISGNTLHDSADAGKALSNLRTLLSSSGAIIILEVTQKRQFHKISMGLIDTYSTYNDEFRLKQNSPLLECGQWKKLISEAGYSDVFSIEPSNGFNGGQSVITAAANKKYLYPDVNEMFETLRKKVMNYMIPDRIVVMEQFPYTSNKKINRKLLPVVEIKKQDTENYEPPKTETEIMLSKILEEVLQNSHLSVTANLINAGIDSLGGITFNAKLQDNGINIGLSQIYAHPTIREIGQLIDEGKNEDIEFGEI
jgi:yersiniabactin nonribosomal peptide synthetase